MTNFSSEQSAIFNQVRYKSKKGKALADEIVQRWKDLEQRLIKVQELTEAVAVEQEEVAIAQTVIANKQKDIAKEQTGIAKELKDITRDLMKVKDEQTEVQKIGGKISELSAVNAGLDADVTDCLDMIDENGAVIPVLLDFCEGYNIRWGTGGFLTLTEIQYNIIKELYFAKKRRMIITRLEEKVWGKDNTPTANNARVTVSHLNAALRQAKCPYRVKRIKRKEKIVSVENPITNNVQSVTTQRGIEMYKLVCRNS